jgi:hypothetical protein
VIKAVAVAALAVAGSFILGRLLVERTRHSSGQQRQEEPEQDHDEVSGQARCVSLGDRLHRFVGYVRSDQPFTRDLQHQQCDCDSEYAVAERFQTIRPKRWRLCRLCLLISHSQILIVRGCRWKQDCGRLLVGDPGLDSGVGCAWTADRDEPGRDHEQRRQREHQTTEPDRELGYEWTARGSCEHIQAIERKRSSAR